MSEEIKTHTLLVALVFPCDGLDDSDVDPDMVADEICVALNEDRQRNADDAGRPDYYQPVEVSAIPAPQWVTSESLQRLRNATDEFVKARNENVRLRGLLTDLVHATEGAAVPRSQHAGYMDARKFALAALAAGQADIFPSGFVDSFPALATAVEGDES